MGRIKASYEIAVHYPDTEEGMLILRKRMGTAYTQFIEEYVLELLLSDEEKNKLYEKVFEQLELQTIKCKE